METSSQKVCNSLFLFSINSPHKSIFISYKNCKKSVITLYIDSVIIGIIIYLEKNERD